MTYEEGYAAGVEDMKADLEAEKTETKRLRDIYLAMQLYVMDAAAECKVKESDAHQGAAIALQRVADFFPVMDRVSRAATCSSSTPKQR